MLGPTQPHHNLTLDSRMTFQDLNRRLDAIVGGVGCACMDMRCDLGVSMCEFFFLRRVAVNRMRERYASTTSRVDTSRAVTLTFLPRMACAYTIRSRMLVLFTSAHGWETGFVMVVVAEARRQGACSENAA